MTRICPPSRATIALALAVALGALVPGVTLAGDPPPPAPYLYTEDAPLTRNPNIKVSIIQPSGHAIGQYRLSNDGLTTNGVLTNGVAVPANGPWTLAPGPDGSRTIYGQVKYSTGMWSAVVQLGLALWRNDARTSFYVDFAELNPLNLPSTADLHNRVTTPGVRIYGRSTSPNWFSVYDDRYVLSFSNENGPLTVGTHHIGPFDETTCTGFCADVSRTMSAHHPCTATGGFFTIHSLVFALSGDLKTADVDYRLICRSSYVMAGSIRYGSNRATYALDQSAERLSFAETNIGQPSASESVTFTNIGNIVVPMGAASIIGANPGDFEITSNTCSGINLAIGAQCTIAVRAEPTAQGHRFAWLSVADRTARGSRSLRLSTFGT